MKLTKFYLIIFLLGENLVLGGCTNQEVYDAIQTNQRNQCAELTGHQRDTCLKNLAPDYSTYEQERKQRKEKNE